LPGAEQHILESIPHSFRLQRLGTHCGVSFKSPDDRIHQFGLQIRRVEKLLFRVISRLLLQGFGFQQFAFDYIVDVNQFVLFGQIPFKQVVQVP